ncbi:MAG: hypothetical protein HN396_17455, partial [Gemmatimonadales bacterium]|nr:hypothetical protein [Gemmatimonadales bacterium]
MRILARITLIIAAFFALSSAESHAQAHASFSVGVGPLFAGVSVGMGGGYYDDRSLFVGTGLGMRHSALYQDPAYEMYSERGRSWGGGSYYDDYSCWDYYWDSFWDPYGDPYYDCLAYSPYGYRNSYRSRGGFSGGWGGYYGSRSAFVFWSDPVMSPWGGSYWGYDRYWGGFADGYYAGRSYGGYYGASYGGYYGGYYGDYYGGYGRTRTVYGGGRTRVAIGRPSPFAGYGVGYKESPRTGTTRTAVRRPQAGNATGASNAPARAGSDGRRTARPSGTDTRAGNGSARP